jgi:protein phosphatase PTC1
MSILRRTYTPNSTSYSNSPNDLYSNGNFSYGGLNPTRRTTKASSLPPEALAQYLDYNYNFPYIDPSIKLAPSKRRSLSTQGGLLNRMFGNSGSNEPPSPKADSPNSPNSSKPNDLSLVTEEPHVGLQKRNSISGAVGRKKEDEGSPVTEKKRRSSSVANAFSKARNSLHLSSSHNSNSTNEAKAETPIQKLGKTDPALAVPHGPNNNSAGESLPTPRSSFRVGVTEDKNKKCRRTMEDTHSFLYNFLGTPAPSIPVESSSNSKKSFDGRDTDADSTSDMSTHVVETDNGYFAIFDGHAGTFAADWCGKKLHVILEDCIRKNPNMAIPELLDMTYTAVDQQLEKLPLKNSGCTAITAVLRWEDRVPNSQSATGSSAVAPQTALAVKAMTDNKTESTDNSETPTQTTPVVAKAASTGNPAAAASTLQEQSLRQRVLYTANVGDARIVLCRNGKALRLSYDHKGSDENEGKRIANAGGLILNNRVNGVLAVTRALGDAYLKDLVTGHPYTTETVIQPDIDEFLILACDGVSSPFHPNFLLLT